LAEAPWLLALGLPVFLLQAVYAATLTAADVQAINRYQRVSTIRPQLNEARGTKEFVLSWV